MSSADEGPSPSPYVHPSQLPLKEIKEPTISKIELSTEDLDKLTRVLQSQKMSPWSKNLKQKKIVGICDDCGQVPDYIITRFYEGLSKILRYCTKCLEQEKSHGKIGNQ